MYALKDLFFLIGVWFIGRADRGTMGEYLEQAGKSIKEFEINKLN